MSNLDKRSTTDSQKKQIVPYNDPRPRTGSPASVASYTVDWVSRLPDAAHTPEPVYSTPSGYGSIHYGTFHSSPHFVPGYPPAAPGYPPAAFGQHPSYGAFGSAPPLRKAPPLVDPEREKLRAKEHEEEMKKLQEELDEARRQTREIDVNRAMEREHKRQKEIDDLVFRETERIEDLQKINKWWSENPEAYKKYTNGG